MNRRVIPFLVLLLLLPGCETAVEPEAPPRVEFLNAPGTESLGLPFSEAVRAGDTLYLSGQLGVRPGTMELVPGGIEAETRQVMENIKTILERNGSSLDRVVKCSVLLADIAEWPAMNEVYRTYFASSPPARSAFGTNGLALGARVEIECIAMAGSGGEGSRP